MAGWYVRRGEKVIGPVELSQLKEAAASGKVLPTELLAKDAAGPWTQANKTTLFAKPKGTFTPLVPGAAAQQQQPQPPPAQEPPTVTAEGQPDKPKRSILGS